MYNAQDTNAEAAYCKMKVSGPLWHFCGSVLIGTGCTMELNLSEYEASSLALQQRRRTLPMSLVMLLVLASPAGILHSCLTAKGQQICYV